MQQTNVLIVEDEPLVAEDIACHLESLGFKVSAIAHSGEEAIEFLNNNSPDVALLDITLSEEKTGIDVANHINANNDIPFVFLTSHADRGTIEQVKGTRPGGYLVKPFDERDLLTSLEMAVSNHLSRDRGQKELTLEFCNEQMPTALSEREFEIIKELKTGKTNVELAEALFLSVNTIKTHLQNIYSKMGVKNRTEALFMLDRMIKGS